jgi:hypothetical protein
VENEKCRRKLDLHGYAGVTTVVGRATSPFLYCQPLKTRIARAKLLMRSVHDFNIVLVNNNLSNRTNGGKGSPVFRLQAFYEAIIYFFTGIFTNRPFAL